MLRLAQMKDEACKLSRKEATAFCVMKKAGVYRSQRVQPEDNNKHNSLSSRCEDSSFSFNCHFFLMCFVFLSHLILFLSRLLCSLCVRYVRQ